MNLPFRIARRYLFSKKSHNAVNVISALSVCGIAVATAVMICLLSVFNGFTDTITLTFSDFDPDLEITVARGKVFNPDDETIQQVLKLDGVAFSAQKLEENALLRYDERQEPIVLRGLSQDFEYIADLNKYVMSGEFGLRNGDIDFGVVGIGIAAKLGMQANSIRPLEIYMPKRNERYNPANPTKAFAKKDAYISGIFMLNQAKYDEHMLIVSIDLVRELLQYTNEVSSIDIKVAHGADINEVQKQIQTILGDKYLVKNRFQQQESTYRMVNIEKWVTFLILTIIIIIAVFNVVGSLSMLILEKMDDITVLQKLGAKKNLICKIFLYEGWLITFIGTVIGLILGLVLCLLQQHFGLISLGNTPGAFIIDAYPVSIDLQDVFITFITVSVVGVLAVFYPVNTLRKKL
ncbi:FtsX-like permease family protein [Dysgonomonas sp. 25]|uniref:FtsX-like permease family protein n=1 Tax=Dysgonomonas sp. 25 TaxID=2302933 RepID=UPI0013D2844F|nr:FtsX-like permease family protein [Dysgonomonas sp. 25]NDV69857.1 ABC transporter permease [Dysgonomonas sp. 25]